MNRRELLAALAATAVMGEGVARGDEAQPVLGSKVFDFDQMTDKPNEVGSQRAVCNTPTATLENLEMHISTLKPGMMSHPPHKHPNEELIILRTGDCETLSNGEWVRVGPGSIVFNASNQLHGFRNVGTEPAVYHVINVKTEKTPKA